ncbi:MAG: GcrA family cell cycle regulator [Paracoccaceae bacterium]
MSWTDERVEQLKIMWNEGQSASQIAKTLGGVTRNAVIGKVHRLGLSNRAAAKPAAPVADLKPAPKPAAPAEPAAEVAAAPEPRAEPTPKPAAPAPVAVIPSAGARREPPPPTPAMVEDAARTAETLAMMEKKARRISLLELTERTCKWPIGDPATTDFFFCGLPCQPGKPYCDTHVVVAFQPMSSRRDRDRGRNRSPGGFR